MASTSTSWAQSYQCRCESTSAPVLGLDGSTLCGGCGLILDGPGLATDRGPSESSSAQSQHTKQQSDKMSHLSRCLLVGHDPSIRLEARKAAMKRTIREKVHQFKLPDSSVDRAMFLIEKILGPDGAPTGKQAERFFIGVLFFVSVESRTSLTLHDCAYVTNLGVSEISWWYRNVHSVLKELGLSTMAEAPQSLTERYEPLIRRHVCEIFSSVVKADVVDDPTTRKVYSVASELVHLAETSGVGTGRTPIAIVAAAISLALEIHLPHIKLEDRKILEPLAKRDNIAKRLLAGKDTVRQREKELRGVLVDVAKKCPWVTMKVDEGNILQFWTAIAPLVRLGNATRHRQSVDDMKKMKEKVDTFGTPGDKDDVSLKNHGWVTGVPKPTPPKQDRPVDTAPVAQLASSNIPTRPVALPKFKNSRALPQSPAPEPPSSSADPPESSPSTSSAPSQPAQSPSISTIESAETPERPRVTPEDIVKQIFPSTLYPAYKNSSALRKSRCLQVRQAVFRLQQSHADQDLPFDAWEAALAAASVEYDAPIKNENPESKPDPLPQSAHRRSVGSTKRSSKKTAKTNEESTGDQDKKPLSSDDYTIETLLIEGVSVSTIIEYGEDLRALLETTPQKLARMEMMLDVEEKAPAGELSVVSAFLPDEDPDFQMRTAEQQKIVRAFLDHVGGSGSVSSTKRVKLHDEADSPQYAPGDISSAELKNEYEYEYEDDSEWKRKTRVKSEYPVLSDEEAVEDC